MNLGIIVLLIFIVIVTGVAYVFSEVILCYYHDLPIDSYIIYGPSVDFNHKIDERIKQVWTFTYTPADHNILEFGFGNTTSTLNLNKRLPSSAKHLVIVPPERKENLELLTLNKAITHTSFDTTDSVPIDTLGLYKTVIVHIDGQYTFWDHISNNNFDILKTARVLILEMDVDLMLKMKPILHLNNFKKHKTYVYLSVWIKNTT